MDTNGHTHLYEDYVSFEIAKLLKEKGFDNYCRAVYEEGKTKIEITDKYWRNTDSDIMEIDDEYNDSFSFVFITAPTHQMAMKWLREVHKCYMHIVPFYPKSKYNEPPKWIAAVDYDGNSYPVLNEKFNTYEEACEALIKYCLTNLI